MEQFAIYLWSIVDQVKFVFAPIVGMGLFAGIFTMFVATTFKLNDVSKTDIGAEKYFSIGKKISISFCILLVLGSLIPSKQDIALIFAYPYIKSGVQNVTQSKQMQKLNQVSILYLDKVIKDLQKTE